MLSNLSTRFSTFITRVGVRKLSEKAAEKGTTNAAGVTATATPVVETGGNIFMRFM